jgi:predicted dehydrogenase
MKKIRWGILSTAKIAREKVIPALQKAENCEVVAIASRNIDLAKATAIQLNIARAYGSYEALMEDREIDAVYIPLPNHLHVPWAVNALAANKHVLCEKPIALSAIEAKELYDFAKQKPQLKIMEAFMYRFHPQWAYIKKLIDDGAIGQLKSMQSLFSYFNMDGNNIRNKKEIGGGGLMDIGCYCISLSRYLFNEEPTSVSGNIIYDPQFHIDNLASGILNFSTGAAVFSCATQLAPCQFANIIGTEARIEVEIPFTPQHDTAARIRLHKNNIIQDIIFETADQYTLQCKLFSQAIIDNTDVPASLMDAVNNMKVLDAIVKSGKEGKLIKIE